MRARALPVLLVALTGTNCSSDKMFNVLVTSRPPCIEFCKFFHSAGTRMSFVQFLQERISQRFRYNYSTSPQ